jgi:general secretion pathway protein A
MNAAYAAAIGFPSGRVQDEHGAYRDLARLWGVSLPDGDPCAAAPSMNLRCYKGGGGLPEIRQLGPPAVLKLHDDANREHFALLTGLTTAGAVLSMAGQQQAVSLVALGRHFRGDFATFWHAPSSFRDQVQSGDRGAEVDWIATQLAKQEGAKPPDAGKPFDQSLEARVREFQLVHGLGRDGIVGPKTFMHLNNAAGVDEPHLKTEPAAMHASSGK